MDIRKLQRAIVDGLEDVKAHHIVVFNTEHLSPLFERVIIASGTSNRQTKALAASVRDAVKSRGMPVLSVEGEDNGEWIIVDCGAAVAHIMQPAIRDYYRLEELWGEKPVKMKIGSGAIRLPRASSQPAALGKSPRGAAHKPGTKKPAPRPKPVKRSAPRKAAAKNTRAGKTASRKTTRR
jgi:ribosome-associated protein